MASAQAEAIKAMLIEFGQQREAEGEITLEEMRANTSSFGEFTAEPDGVIWEPVDAGGVPAIWAIPDGGAGDRVVEYLHGGGYVLMSAEIYKRLTGHLAKRSAVGFSAWTTAWRPRTLTPARSTTASRRTAGSWTRDTDPSTSPSPVIRPVVG